LSRLIPLIRAESYGREIWETAFGSKGELNDQGVASLCANVRHLENEDPDAARELLLLTMSTLPRPYEALRVLNKVSHGVDDRRLDITEFAVIGRRVIATALRAADMINSACDTNRFDGEALAKAVERYNQSLHGLEREANLASDGPWRKAALGIRSKVGNQLEILCQRATHNLQVALPIERVQRSNFTWHEEPKLHHEPDMARAEIAAQGLAFVAASRLFAPLAGFGAPREAAAKHAGIYLDNVSEAILKASRMASKPVHIEKWVHATATLLEAFEGVKVAHVFERRAAAAATAA
jgi:hypothetical protein